MFTGSLEKISSNHNNLRTDTIEGIFKLPIVGEDFVLHGEGLLFGTRVVRTTPVEEVTIVQELDKKAVITFKTKNSTYQILNFKQNEIPNDTHNNL